LEDRKTLINKSVIYKTTITQHYIIQKKIEISNTKVTYKKCILITPTIMLLSLASRSSQKIREMFKFLNSDSVVLTSGFLLGFIHSFKLNKETIERPYSTLGNASIDGFFTLIGAGVLSLLLPRSCLFLIPSTTLVSCTYYKYKDLTTSEKSAS